MMSRGWRPTPQASFPLTTLLLSSFRFLVTNGNIFTRRGKEGSSTRSRVRIDCNGGGSMFHFLTSLTETMNYARRDQVLPKDEMNRRIVIPESKSCLRWKPVHGGRSRQRKNPHERGILEKTYTYTLKIILS
jgi:hypothetical protein